MSSFAAVFGTFFLGRRYLKVPSNSSRYIPIIFEKISEVQEVISTQQSYIVKGGGSLLINQGDGPKINESPFWFILRVLEALIVNYLPLQSWIRNVFLHIFLWILSSFHSNLAQKSAKTVEMSRFDLTLKSSKTFPLKF